MLRKERNVACMVKVFRKEGLAQISVPKAKFAGGNTTGAGGIRCVFSGIKWGSGKSFVMAVD